MSNLTYSVATGKYSVNFDVLRGWPNGGAIEDSFVVASGKTVTEGQFVVLGGTAAAPTVDVGAAVLVTSPALRVVIQGNDQFDAKFVGKASTLRGKVTIKTEKFVPTSVAGVTAYVPGVPLTVIGGAGIYTGFLCSRSNVTGAGVATDVSTGTLVGYVEEYDSNAGTLIVALDV
jgi:hypothetical protein